MHYTPSSESAGCHGEKKSQNFCWAGSVIAGGPQVLLLMRSSVNKFFYPRKSQNKFSNLTLTKYSFNIFGYISGYILLKFTVQAISKNSFISNVAVWVATVGRKV